VTIGERAVIGANSVVTKDIPAHTIAAGAPARALKEIAYDAPSSERAAAAAQLAPADPDPKG
jgi:acetyltransferase-like isoleucine patch superfamily enzyme